ncbi:MAG: hypothetical protein OEZ15_07685, partial [Gammaproteobacteria bacterium]|nr:hypothetical protein [Gammaproteobacteria bacterium]
MKKFHFIVCFSGLLAISGVQAATFDDIDYNRLKIELGTAIPNGTGVQAAFVESSINGAWIPDPANAQFTGKTFVEKTTGSSGYSAHATSVGRLFFGNTYSTTPAIINIDLYEAINWMTTGFLLSGPNGAPGVSAARVANHSWISDAGNVTSNVEILRHVDYVVSTDEFIQVASSNTTPTTTHLLADSLNAIKVSVPVSAGSVTEALSSIYAAGRARADILAPESTLSGATPRIASAAALLVGHAHSNPTLSSGSGSTTNRNGDTIYNAERSETIKAILMAGADRRTSGNTNPAANPLDITDYRVDVANQTSNGLDKRFGAGQLNIYNSYHILNAGEQNSSEDSGSNISNLGFDYDAAFGGQGGTNGTATYNFTTGAAVGQKLKAALVWNVKISTLDALYNLDLQLIDVTAGNTVVASSTSAIDSTENLWVDLKN